MIATVISVTPAKLKGKWDGYDFTYQGEPFQGRDKDPTTRFVFKNDTKNPQVPEVVKNLEAGQKVDLTFEKNGKFSNLVGVAVVNESAKPTATSGASPKKNYAQQDDDTALRIARSVALKAAIDMQQAMIMGGAKIVKATMKEDIFADQTLAVAKQFEQYLTLKDDDEVIAAVMDEVDTEVPFEMVTFDD